MSSALAISSDGSAHSQREHQARALDRWSAGPLGGGALLLLSCASIQVGAAIATTTFSSINPAGAAGLRFALAALVLLAVVRPRVKSWDFGRWRAVILFGIAAAGNEVCLYLALDRLPLGMAVTLEFLGPLSLAILAARRWTHMWMLGLALGGVAIKRAFSLNAHHDGLQPTQHQGGLAPTPESRRQRANDPPSLAQHRL